MTVVMQSLAVWHYDDAQKTREEEITHLRFICIPFAKSGSDRNKTCWMDWHTQEMPCCVVLVVETESVIKGRN